MSFLNGALSRHVNNLRQTQPDTLEGQKKAFPHLWKYFKNKFPDVDEADFVLLLRKGIYPYQWVKSFDVFQSQELPPPSEFKDSLKNQSISPEDYQHAQDVWKAFNITNFGEYNDLYLGKIKSPFPFLSIIRFIRA